MNRWQRQLVGTSLLGALSLGGLALLLFEPRFMTETVAPQLADRLFPGFDAAKAKSLTLELPGTARLHLERRAARSWELTEPYKENAAQEGVDGLLRALELLRFARRLPLAATNEATMGPSRGALTVEEDGLSRRLVLGGAAPTPSEHSYLLVTGTGVPEAGLYVVPDAALGEVFPSADRLRSRRLVSQGLAELASVRAEWPGGTWLLQRRGDRRFTVQTQYGPVLADASALQRLDFQLTRFEVTTLLDPSALHQSASPLTLELTPEDPRAPASALQVGGACTREDEVVALRTAPERRAGCVPASLLSALSLLPTQLAEQRVLGVELSEVERISFAHDAVRLELAREGAGWKVLAPSDAKLDAAAVEQLMTRLGNVVGTLRGGPGAQLTEGAAKAELQLTLAGTADPPVTFAVSLLSAPDGALVARRGLDRAELQLDASAASLLKPELGLLRAREVWRLEENKLAAVSIQTESTLQRLERSESGLRLRQPAGAQQDAAATDQLLATLTKLDTARWVATQVSPAQGFARPRLRIDVRLVGGSGQALERHLEVGAATRGGYFARVDSADAVFVLSGDDYDRLSALLLDRSVFLLAPISGARLRLADGKDAAFELSASDTEWQTPTRRATHELTLALATLGASGVVHLGAPRAIEGFVTPVLVADCTLPDGTHRRWRMGAADIWNGQSVYFGRVDGVDATYALPYASVTNLLRALDALEP